MSDFAARPLVLTAWLAAPPTLRDAHELVFALVDDLLLVLRPYAIRTIYTSEPRYYRLGSTGRARLAEALTSGQVENLHLGSDPATRAQGSAVASLFLGSKASVDTATRVGIRIQPYEDSGAEPALIARQLVHFVARWFGRLRAAAAFVSDRLDDDTNCTVYEAERSQGALFTWPALRRYSRGVFWGTGLGPDHCAQLGGREQVLRDAPADVRRPLEEGVWLQLSEVPPAEPYAYRRLGEYLAPLMTWTRDDVQLMVPSAGDTAETASSAIARQPAELPSIPGTLQGLPSGSLGRRRAVPMRLIGGDVEVQTGLNVYLSEPPTPGQLEALIAAVQAWYQEGFDGAFPSGLGQGAFHHLFGPSVEGAVLRWHVDFGSADERHALKSLRMRLADVTNVSVLRLIVGTETL
jgi:hypothetical protein